MPKPHYWQQRASRCTAGGIRQCSTRALDYCDVISPGWHPSSSDIPVALASAELTGASGLEMLAALAIGQDFAQRINLAAQANDFFLPGIRFKYSRLIFRSSNRFPSVASEPKYFCQ
ncbi:MmgE/PrpD family protein [Salmonella enterica subsp. enterica serovar Wedding]